MFSLSIFVFVTAVLSIVSILRCVWVAVYRLCFHPLATIPGPLVARATYLYAFWYNMHGGSFYLQVQKLHEQYGMSVALCDEVDLFTSRS